jgi:hypothetical protein
MELRPELTPTVLDEAKVARLAKLADRIDGAAPGQWEDELDEFNRLASTELKFEDFQGIYGAENHEDFVRRVLYQQAVASETGLSRADMVEIASRVIRGEEPLDFYLELFLVNCKHPSRSDLFFWPSLVPELPQDRPPTAEEIADLALRGRA